MFTEEEKKKSNLKVLHKDKVTLVVLFMKTKTNINVLKVETEIQNIMCCLYKKKKADPTI